MGASVGAGRKSGGRRRRGVPRYGAMADINMTPFIDVMLVLLIIFMVAAPLLTSGVAVDLPQAKAGQLNVDQKPVAIAIDDKSQVFLADQPVADADFLEKLKSLAKDDTETRIYLRAEGARGIERSPAKAGLFRLRRDASRASGDDRVRLRLGAQV